MFKNRLNQIREEAIEFIINSTNNREGYSVAVTPNRSGKVINVNSGEKLIIDIDMGDGNSFPMSIRSMKAEEIINIADQIYHEKGD